MIKPSILAAMVVSSNAPVFCAEISQAQAQEKTLINLVRQDCGSCHGLRLTGGLGPPLTAQALQGKPRALLVNSILHGRPGTPMPAWQPLLSQYEIEWIVDTLIEGNLE